MNNTTFKIDWTKALQSKTIRSLIVLGISLVLMFAFKQSEADASAAATKYASYIDYALMLIAGGSFMTAATSRVYADGPLTKSVEQVKAEAQLKDAKKAAKTAAKLAKIQNTHGK